MASYLQITGQSGNIVVDDQDKRYYLYKKYNGASLSWIRRLDNTAFPIQPVAPGSGEMNWGNLAKYAMLVPPYTTIQTNPGDVLAVSFTNRPTRAYGVSTYCYSSVYTIMIHGYNPEDFYECAANLTIYVYSQRRDNTQHTKAGLQLFDEQGNLVFETNNKLLNFSNIQHLSFSRGLMDAYSRRVYPLGISAVNTAVAVSVFPADNGHYGGMGLGDVVTNNQVMLVRNGDEYGFLVCDLLMVVSGQPINTLYGHYYKSSNTDILVTNV